MRLFKIVNKLLFVKCLQQGLACDKTASFSYYLVVLSLAHKETLNKYELSLINTRGSCYPWAKKGCRKIVGGRG